MLIWTRVNKNATPRQMSAPESGLLDLGFQDSAQRIARRERAATDELQKWLGKIHCADCLDLMRQMPPASVDLILTSPPYNLRNTTGGGVLRGGGKFSAGRKIQNGYQCHDDAMPHADYVRWQRDCLSEMMRLIKPTGAIFYNHKWRVQNGLLQDRADIVGDLPVRQIIIWQRGGGINFNSNYFLPTYEVIYLIAGKDFKLAPKANANGDVWHITPEKKVSAHVCPFPLELARRVIKSTTADIVLDPFIGSGTTAIAAEQLERLWIGIEKNPDYVEAANKRIAEACPAGGNSQASCCKTSASY